MDMGDERNAKLRRLDVTDSHPQALRRHSDDSGQPEDQIRREILRLQQEIFRSQTRLASNYLSEFLRTQLVQPAGLRPSKPLLSSKAIGSDAMCLDDNSLLAKLLEKQRHNQTQLSDSSEWHNPCWSLHAFTSPWIVPIFQLARPSLATTVSSVPSTFCCTVVTIRRWQSSRNQTKSPLSGTVFTCISPPAISDSFYASNSDCRQFFLHKSFRSELRWSQAQSAFSAPLKIVPTTFKDRKTTKTTVIVEER